jgi:hypothetical protein
MKLRLHFQKHLTVNINLPLPKTTTTREMTMLPPIEPETAQANPKFDALYRDLCTNKLNSDGSTKLDMGAQKEREAFLEVGIPLRRH